MYAYGDDIEDRIIGCGDKVTFNETVPLIRSETTIELRVIHIPTNTIIYVGKVTVK